MLLSELNMHCDNCSIIDYCNDFESTPPCEQPRLENMDVLDFLRLADSSEYSDADAIIDDVYERGGRGK